MVDDGVPSTPADDSADESAATAGIVIVRIVLAAGAGSRMGRTKALLPYDGATALERLARLAFSLDGGRAETVVVTGHDHHAVATEANRVGFHVACNPNWHGGQTSSLQCGIRVAREFGADVVILHPVDFPLITQGDYDACLHVLRDVVIRETNSSAHAAIIVTSHAMRRGHPLLFGRDLFDDFLALGADVPARDVVRRHGDRIHYAVVENEGVLVDVDTPEAYNAARLTTENRTS